MVTPRQPRVALITDPAMPELQPDDAGLPGAFAERGVEVVVLPWGSPPPVPRCVGALVRSPWEYFMDPERFLRWAEEFDGAVLNPPEVLRWNHDKRYLLELAGEGSARIPATALVTATELGAATETGTGADAVLERIGAARGVLKPTVSGGAWRTAVLERGAGIPAEVAAEDGGDFLVQAFVDELPQAGEWSLTYFAGSYSHAVLKRSSPGDFRVQEEHGGSVEVLEPPAALREEAEQILRATPGSAGLVYARVDLVEASDGRPYLMELELIEPELFLRARPGAAQDLARAVVSALGVARSAHEA